jgi:hypothetical protein
VGAANALILVACRSNPVRRIDESSLAEIAGAKALELGGKLEDSYSGDVPGDSCK